ncbi:MAG TPA: ABC transporter permease [Gaiellales bacterium]|jgi:ribose transport system permease protein
MAEPTLATQAEIAADQDLGDRRKRQLERRRRFAERLQGQGLLLILAGVILIMWWSSPYFMSVDNLFTAAAVVSILGIMAVVETMLIISGEIDISIGSVMALTSVVIGSLVGNGMNVWIAVVISLFLAAAIGGVNGVLTVWLRINSLVVTLGMYSIVLGVAYVLSDSTTVIIDGSGFDWLGSSYVWRIPVPVFFFLAVWIIGQYVLRTTALGRHVYAVGDSAESAVRAGVRADGLRIGLFVAMSLSAALAGIIVTSQLSSAAPQIGDPYLLSVVTAVILGGASLAGGRGTLRGTLISIAILGVLQNGFALLQYSVYTQYIVQGGLLIFAVLTDQLVRRAER